MDCGSEKLVSVSISQYELILWYFTANSFQLSSAIEGDVTDSINNIFLTHSSSLCSHVHMSHRTEARCVIVVLNCVNRVAAVI